MKKIYMILGGLLLTMFASHCFAEEYTVGVCGVQSENSTNIGYILICKDDNYPNGWRSKNGCPYHGFVGWDLSAFQGKSMYATALTAFSLDKQVTIRLNIDWKTCIGTDIYTFDHTQIIRIIK